MELSMSWEPTLAGMWTKSEEVLKSQGWSESSFSTKVKSRAEARVEKKLWLFQVSNIWKLEVTFFASDNFSRGLKKILENFLGMLLKVKEKL